MTDSTKTSPTMIAIKATGLMRPVLGRRPLLDGAEGVTGIVIGDDATVVEPGPGSRGDATAPSEPGLVGSLVKVPQLSSGGPQRPVFWAKAESGKFDRVLGISPESLLPEILNSCRFGRSRPEIGPVNEFPSRRRVRR